MQCNYINLSSVVAYVYQRAEYDDAHVHCEHAGPNAMIDDWAISLA